MTTVAALDDAFDRAFGRAPDAAWFAPGRVNVIGEHTDHNDGHVLPFAIDVGVSVGVGLARHGELRCWSSTLGRAAPVDLSAPVPAQRGWQDMVLGTVLAIATRAAVDVTAVGGLDVAVTADVPAGAGLSSSAALESATIAAVAEVLGARLNGPEIAAMGRQLEHAVFGVPCGPMDQMASVLGRAGHGLLIDCRDLTIEYVPIDAAAHGLGFLVVDSGVRHRHSDNGYATRRAECARAAELLSVIALRDADLAMLAAADLPPVLHRRARHVITEERRVLDLAAQLRRGDVSSIGAILDASHTSLRDDFEVSCRELDIAVESARRGGALGARMIGGGFGGSILAVVPVERLATTLDAVRAAFARERLPVPASVIVEPGPGLARLGPTRH